MQLNDFQHTFREKMLEAAPIDMEPSPLNDLFKPNNVRVSSRLAIYRNNILENMRNVLEITYPVVHQLVGDDFFRQVAYAYIRFYPPQSGNVNLYGDKFPDFLAEKTKEANLPYMQDIAQYEFYINKSYYAPDDDALSLSQIHTIKEADYDIVRFHLRASACLQNPRYAVDDIKNFVTNPNRDEAETFDLSKPGTPLLIFRPEFKVHIESLAPDDYAMLLSLHEGDSLSDALNKTLEDFPNFNFQQFINYHLNLGTFVDITKPEK